MTLDYERAYKIGQENGVSSAVVERIAAALRAQADAEAVAIVGSDFQLGWIGSGPIAPIVAAHNIKVGDKLYTSPSLPAAQGLSDAEKEALTEAIELVTCHGGRGWSDTKNALQRVLDRAATVAEPSVNAPMGIQAFERMQIEIQAQRQAVYDAAYQKAAQQQAEPSACPECEGSGIGTFAGDPCHVCKSSQQQAEPSKIGPRGRPKITDIAENGPFMRAHRAAEAEAAQQQAEPVGGERKPANMTPLETRLRILATDPVNGVLAAATMREAADALAAQSGQRAGVAEDVIDAAAKKLAEAFDYPWEYMPAQGKDDFRAKVRDIAAMLAARTQQQQQERSDG